MSKPFRQKRLGKKAKQRAKKAAKHLPAHMQDVAFSLASNRAAIKGTFGAASAVRHIDPAEYEPWNASATPPLHASPRGGKNGGPDRI